MDSNKLLIVPLLSTAELCSFSLGAFSTTICKLLQTIGVILLITGGIVTIIGIISKEKNIIPIQSPRDRTCLKCGKTIPFDASICPYCKYDFKQIKIDYPKDLP